MSELKHPQNDLVLSRRLVLSGSACAWFSGLSGSVFLANRAFSQGKAANASSSTSALAQSSHSSLRLVSGGAADSQVGVYHAGLVMELKPGFKTYWRSPGDSGVPPVFNFDNSLNLAKAEIFYPAPKRFPDGAGGHSFGYDGPEVVFPVLLRAIDASKPVQLQLKADYAVCETICIPSGGEVSLVVSGMAGARHAVTIAEARSRVPVRQKLHEGDALKIMGIEKAEKPEHFLVVVSLTENSGKDMPVPELFVEGETPWFFDVKSVTRSSGDKNTAGVMVFLVAVIERSKAADCTGAEITLTLVSGKQSIEVPARLDLGLVTH